MSGVVLLFKISETLLECKPFKALYFEQDCLCTCLIYEFTNIIESSLESVKETEQNASERCADGQEIPRLEGSRTVGVGEILLSFQTRS